MNFNTLYRAAMQKRAAAVLTPEAEQAAVQGGMGDPMAQGGMPPAPGGMPPQDPAAMGGTPAGPQGSGGGQLPPEIAQDQQFIQWLAAQDVQMDPATGMFIGPDGQPLSVEAIMQAYQVYQQEMAAQGGAPGGMPPQDPAAMAQGGMPPAPGGMPPQDPAAMGGAPAGGQIPPEILNDQMFMQFMQEAVGAQFDPNTGSFMDPQSGQPMPPDLVMQAYQAYQQEVAAQGGGSPGGMPPQDPSAMGGAPAEQEAGGPAAQLPPEIMDQFQSMVDTVLQNYTAQLEKKLETMLDKIETIGMALESIRDTDDKRAKQDKDALKEMQDELAEELNPTVKTASETVSRREAPKKHKSTRPLNVFDFLKIQ